MFTGLDFLLSLDFAGLVTVFWFYFLFEVPRYTFSTLAVGWRAAFETDLPSAVHRAGPFLCRRLGN